MLFFLLINMLNNEKPFVLIYGQNFCTFYMISPRIFVYKIKIKLIDLNKKSTSLYAFISAFSKILKNRYLQAI